MRGARAWRWTMAMAVCGAACASLGAPVAAGAEQASFVIWSGGLTPDSSLAGVLVHQDGSGEVMRVGADQRERAGVSVVARFSLTGAARDRVNAAAVAASRARAFTSGAAVEDGAYASAVVDVGGRTHAVVGVNAGPPELAELIRAVRAVVPNAARASQRGTEPVVLPTEPPKLNEDNLPRPPCKSGVPAVDISRILTLQQAERAGAILELSSKGQVQGDAVKVRAVWKRVPGVPIVVTVNAEFLPPDVEGEVAKDWAGIIRGNLERKFAGTRIASGPEKGTPIQFRFNFFNRLPDQTPQDCFHQVQMGLIEREVTGLGPRPAGSFWGFDPDNVNSWGHELGHAIGLDDSYHDVFVVQRGPRRGRVFPLPRNGLEGEELAAALARFGVRTESGVVESETNRGAPKNDIMDVSSGRLEANRTFQSLIERAPIVIQDAGGTVLVNKRSGNRGVGPSGAIDHEQNMVTAGGFGGDSDREGGGGGDNNQRRGGFTLRVPYRKTASINGLIAYCIDANRERPAIGVQFDVLGPAADMTDPGMQALARVAQVVRASPRASGGSLVLGAQDAIWRVTDGINPDGDEARTILAAAAVPADADFVTPHFSDPNERSPRSAAVTLTGLLPRIRALPAGPAPRPRIRGVALDPSVVPAGRSTSAVVTIELTGAPARVRLVLERRVGRRFRRVKRLGSRRVPVGSTASVVALGRLARGSYRLVAIGPHSRKSARLQAG